MMPLKPRLKILLVTLLVANHCFGQQEFSIVPQPQTVKMIGKNFEFSANTTLPKTTPAIFAIAAQEIMMLKKDRAKGISNKISFVRDQQLKPESYQLTIDGTNLTITANDSLGAFWAVQTIRQLAGESIFNHTQKISLPGLAITDEPKFHWRGVHLDVSRHFFDMDYLKVFLDRMALYKFNKFHWHLTDDQGWRIEIKKYPQLTEKGAWRKLNNQDSVCLELAKTNPDYKLPEKHFKTINGERLYGGFYTQNEIKGLVKYATSKGIEIIPEIDMPGHMQAATRLFPWLTSSGSVQKGKDFTDPICPCKETTFEFAENLFKEIAMLFPSPYIHLGADEVEKISWEKSMECQELMKRENLKSTNEIHAYFVKRMERYFNKLGKKLIGWDEILEGEVSNTATVMYWRTWLPKAPKIAANNGNDLIMTPGEYCYFDAKQDEHSLKKVFSFDPTSFGLSASDRKFVLGGQASIWTEYIPSEQRLEYMIFPRLLAMSEVLWGKRQDFKSFESSLAKQYELLDAMKVNYRYPDLKGFAGSNVFVQTTSLQIEAPKGMQVRYTLDGRNPTSKSPIYQKPLEIDRPVVVKAAIANKNGRIGEVFTIPYVQSNYKSGTILSNPKKGLNFSYYPKFYKSVVLVDERDRTQTDVTKAIEIPVADQAASFATRHVGYFYAPEDNTYSFYLRSDDGSVLKMHHQTLIDNDGMHAAFEKSAQIALQKGYHPFELIFLEGGGGYTLELEYSKGSGPRQKVSPIDFYRSKN